MLNQLFSRQVFRVIVLKNRLANSQKNKNNMDDAELTRLAIEEIVRGMGEISEPRVQERKINPIAKPNKRFLGRTINSMMTHNKREDDRTQKNCRQKLKELDDERMKRRYVGMKSRSHSKYRELSLSSSTSGEECTSEEKGRGKGFKKIASRKRRIANRERNKTKKYKTKRRSRSSSSSSSSTSTSRSTSSSSDRRPSHKTSKHKKIHKHDKHTKSARQENEGEAEVEDGFHEPFALVGMNFNPSFWLESYEKQQIQQLLQYNQLVTAREAVENKDLLEELQISDVDASGEKLGDAASFSSAVSSLRLNAESSDGSEMLQISLSSESCSTDSAKSAAGNMRLRRKKAANMKSGCPGGESSSATKSERANSGVKSRSKCEMPLEIPNMSTVQKLRKIPKKSESDNSSSCLILETDSDTSNTSEHTKETILQNRKGEEENEDCICIFSESSADTESKSNDSNSNSSDSETDSEAKSSAPADAVMLLSTTDDSEVEIVLTAEGQKPLTVCEPEISRERNVEEHALQQDPSISEDCSNSASDEPSIQHQKPQDAKVDINLHLRSLEDIVETASNAQSTTDDNITITSSNEIMQAVTTTADRNAIADCSHDSGVYEPDRFAYISNQVIPIRQHSPISGESFVLSQQQKSDMHNEPLNLISPAQSQTDQATENKNNADSACVSPGTEINGSKPLKLADNTEAYKTAEQKRIDENTTVSEGACAEHAAELTDEPLNLIISRLSSSHVVGLDLSRKIHQHQPETTLEEELVSIKSMITNTATAQNLPAENTAESQLVLPAHMTENSLERQPISNEDTPSCQLALKKSIYSSVTSPLLVQANNDCGSVFENVVTGRSTELTRTDNGNSMIEVAGGAVVLTANEIMSTPEATPKSNENLHTTSDSN